MIENVFKQIKLIICRFFLSKMNSDKLYKICDKHLLEIVKIFNPEWVIGIGGFAEKRIISALSSLDIKTGKILHPSPASPMANRGWAEIAENQLKQILFAK